MTRERVWSQLLDQGRLDIAVRAGALGLTITLSAVVGSAGQFVPQIVLLTLLAISSVLPVSMRALRRWRPPVEALLAGLIISTASLYDPVLLPYLVAPALSAGLIGGWRLATISTGASLAGLLLPRANGAIATGDEYVVDAVQWSLLALVVGLLAAWVQRVQTEVPSDDVSYQEAARLLTQLREISRELSGGLDAISIATAMLDELQDEVDVTRAWVFGYRSGGVPVPLAFGPGVDPELHIDLTPGSIWSQTISAREPVVTSGPLGTDPSMCGALIPILFRDSVVGLVALERRGTPWSQTDVDRVQYLVNLDAARIDASLLFDEVRHAATAEERQRLAREIHDGVAQEVASLGYLVDDLFARAPVELKRELGGLRDELSRVVSELRYSIFDLRREVGPGATLASVLADHARHVAETAGIAVHLELSESPARLRPAVEAELLRIAQEAIANARKHSRAKNLWVTCQVDAPVVLLRVEDDGRGLLPPREDSFGLAIMRERADRAGCELTVRTRSEGGTTVEVRTRLVGGAGDGQHLSRTEGKRGNARAAG